MLTNALRVLINNSFKESFYKKRNKNNEYFDIYFYFLKKIF